MPSLNLPDRWLLDACSALNFAASARLEAILQVPIAGKKREFWMPEKVLQEATALRRGGAERDAEEREPVDWQPFITSGLIQITRLENSDEVSRFVSLTQFLDDGESMCLSIAISRGWGVITDDRAAQKRAGQVDILTTPDLIKNWAEGSRASPQSLYETLKNIQEHARYGPPRNHSLRSWWIRAATLAGGDT